MKANQLETGYPLAPEGKRISADGNQDYHFANTTEGGFVIIKAQSLDQAADIARSAPIIENGGYILARTCGEAG